jgi:hypothetical protein
MNTHTYRVLLSAEPEGGLLLMYLHCQIVLFTEKI